MILIDDIIEGNIKFNVSGSAYLVSDKIPKDIYIHKSKTNKSLHLDDVKIKIIKGVGRAIEGEVIEIVKRFKDEFVGVIQVSPKHAFFIPDNNKINIDFFIPLKNLNGAVDGQKVVAKLVDWKDKARNPNGEIIRIIGNVGEHETEIHAILEEFSLPYNFPDEVLDEANIIPSDIMLSESKKRLDLRNVRTISIDPIDSKDADDTIGLKVNENETISVYINIADVSHYVRPNTALDKEALNRGTSVYLCDRVVPMLPERLSNNICSLKSGSDKLAMTAMFTFDAKFNIVDKWFGRTIINVDKDYSYEEAQEIIESSVETVDLTNKEEMHNQVVVLTLTAISKILRNQRLKNSPLVLDKQELRFKLDENNKPVDIIFKTSKDSNKLIEEFMLLANKEVAKLLKTKIGVCVNRAHEIPNQEKIEELRNFTKNFGYILDINPSNFKKSINEVLEKCYGKPEYNMIQSLVMKMQQKAYYTTKNVGHYGLSFDDYSHFTSPIRRYSDIITHRLLALCLTDAITPDNSLNINKIESNCQHISATERKAQKAERDSIKYMSCIYMSERIGRIYSGTVTSVSDYGLFVTITENQCDGFIKLSEINGDTFIADMENYRIKGHNTGEIISLGDTVSVIVSSVDIEKKNINFNLLKL